MEVEKGSKRSCFTQTSYLDEDLVEDSQLEYLSAHEEYEEDENNSSEFSEQREIGEVKDMPLMGDKVPLQITAREEESGKSDRPIHSVAVEPDIPFLLHREKAQLDKHAESSDFSSCEKPAVHTRGVDSTAEDAESQFPVSEILPSKNPDAGMEAAGKSPGGSCSAGKPEHREGLKSVPSVSVVVQAGSGARAGSPVSRSSSAQVCLCSRAVNTEVTMMNKTQPLGWLGQTFVDAASKTKQSFRAQSSHIQQESKDHLFIRDWKAGTNRPEHPNKQTRKNSASSCCQRILQRATEAELQLLAVHYEMCYQHCWKVYELALEENTYFGRCEEKTELHSSLLLVLDELDNNYSNMRMEINMGIPLNELPPLSVELKFPPVSSLYAPSKFFRKSLYSDDLSGEGKADFEESKVQEKGISVNMVGNSSLDKSQNDGDQPSASPETWEEQPKAQALECGCVKDEEGSEYWSDAKEDLSVADISVMCKETKKHPGKQDSIDSREVKTVDSGNKRSSVHVDGPKHSVSEDPGEDSICPCINSGGVFVSPYALNLSSFTKLIKRLQERYPEFNRERIVDAVQEVRKNHKGVLSGMAISSIEEEASAILRKWMHCCRQEKQSSRSAAGAEPARPRERSRSCRGAMALLPRRFLCFVLAQHFIAATACQEADYGWMIRHYCLKQFQLSMEGIGQRLWCDWDETVGTYGELTNCTALIAERLDCYWPNRLVDEFFVAVHKQYFRNCSPSGRALHDPPNGVLCPFIVLPVLVTLLMTALVVWRSKRSEGIV
ncbi:RNA-binding protein 44-like [Corvus hawaiiensis]|nr:RNA-binding protein 44-like [Corvus hawaiiensis]